MPHTITPGPAAWPPSRALWLGLPALAGLYLTSLYSYLLFHSLAEAAVAVVGLAVFLLAYNARAYLDSAYLLFLGIAYLFISALHLLHALAYKGMGVFQGFDANLPTQLWIAARYFLGVAYLLAPLFLRRSLKAAWALAGFGAAFLLVLLTVFHWRVFPDCFLEGRGLTPFKIISEYVIMAMFLAAGLLLWANRPLLGPRLAPLLIGSLVLSMAAELAFTTYISVYGPANLVGHLFLVASVYLAYRAIVAEGLRRPYDLLFHNLRRSEQTARALLNATHDAAFLIDAQGQVLAVNQEGARRLGSTPEQMVGRDVYAMFRPEVAERRRALNRQVFDSGHPMRYLDQRDGMWFDVSANPLTDSDGRVESVAVFVQEITEQRRHEQERDRLVEELRQALAEVQTLSGLLPICAHCKRIRDDSGYWNQIEAYISRRSGARFTHGICPQCAQALYPELAEELRAKGKPPPPEPQD